MIFWNKVGGGHYESEDKRFSIKRSWWWGKGIHYHLYDKENCVKTAKNGFCGYCYEYVDVDLCKLRAEYILRQESTE